jgi:hypothetical protein
MIAIMSIFKCNKTGCKGFGKPDTALYNKRFSVPVREGSITLVEWLEFPKPMRCLKCSDCGHSWVPSNRNKEMEALVLEHLGTKTKLPLTRAQIDFLVDLQPFANMED